MPPFAQYSSRFNLIRSLSWSVTHITAVLPLPSSVVPRTIYPINIQGREQIEKEQPLHCWLFDTGAGCAIILPLTPEPRLVSRKFCAAYQEIVKNLG
mmetsp:Transcript_27932/g.57205  ORF Transcript_27932/g.57205 Transcript_27932/m.57205 type:complete len:97 (-) Transcript_27932:61-351(-)